ncbi:ribonuclease PH [Haliangium sp.]|uniref:ribonuclease PH n=1 Tax=Haliangium sp. TaxID=2663208 RepID=UPI003D101CAE
MPRPDGRRPDELRPIEIITGYQKHAEGSALIKTGDTWVLCAASVEAKVPPFLADKGRGWVTAEYAMLPRATHTRSGRNPGGRGKEIQRLIGRALRAAVNMKALGERTITVDCDVLQADGGTRVASITGGWVAIALAIDGLVAAGELEDAGAVLSEPLAAVSVGIVDGEPRLDLPYAEDSTAAVDMNVVMTASGNLVEIQGTGEQGTFTRAELDRLVDLAAIGVARLCSRQREVVAAARASAPGSASA